MIASALGLLLAASLSSAGADEHLLAGAQRFREGRFEEALVEFRAAQRLGAEGVEPYVASTLVKLGRYEEAVERFGASDAPGPDPLVDYYRALACWGAKLYGCADRLLAGVGDRSGPKIGGEAARQRAALAAELKQEPSRATVDWYLARCEEARKAGRAALAHAYCREGAELATRRGDHYRLAEAREGAAPLSERKP